MPRQMANQQFRQDQWNRRYDSHISPINKFVDEMRESGNWAPYVPPMYGGTQARLLSVLRDPGPKTQDGKGSGFICMENDDPTAERMCNLFASVNIGASDIVPWNVYPWYINRVPTASELKIGLKPLKQIIEMMPELKVIMLHGGSAHNGWKHFTRAYSEIATNPKLRVISTYHTSLQAFFHPDPDVREARKQHLQTSFQDAARHLGI